MRHQLTRWLVRAALVALIVAAVAGDLIVARAGHSLTAGATATPTPRPATCPERPAGGALSLLSSPANVRVSDDTYLAHSEPMLAENPLDPRNLVGGSKFFTDPRQYEFKIGTYASFDGGCTWLDGGLLPGMAAYHIVSDISFAFGPGGEVYGAVLVLGPATAHVFSGVAVSKSLDGGRTFSLPVLVYGDPSGDTFHDKPWITVDLNPGPTRGNVYVAWTDNATGSPIVFSRSTDGGASWSRPVAISGHAAICTIPRPDLDPASHLCANSEGAVPVVTNDDTLVVVFAYADLAFFAPDAGHHAPPIPTRLLAVSSRDGGVTWSQPSLVATVADPPFELPHATFRFLTMPAVAADPVRGWVYVAWTDERAGDADVLLAHSTDDGRTWSAPVRVNDDPPGDHADQFQPQLATARDGVLAVSFFDRRLDPAGRLIDTFVAQSVDGGQTFLPNVRASSQSWNPAAGAPSPDIEDAPDETFIGDYQGLAMDDHAVHPFWTDSRNGTQQIYTATLPAARPVASPKACVRTARDC